MPHPKTACHDLGDVYPLNVSTSLVPSLTGHNMVLPGLHAVYMSPLDHPICVAEGDQILHMTG